MKKPLLILSIILSFTAFLSTQTVLTAEANIPIPDQSALGGAERDEAKKAEIVKHLGNLPAFFIENQGQTAEEVRYYFKGNDTVYFTDEGVVFQKIGARGQGLGTREACRDRALALSDSQRDRPEGLSLRLRNSPAIDGRGKVENPPFFGRGEGEPRSYRWEGQQPEALTYRLEFVGANPTSPQARNALQGKVNYFIGNDASKWHNNIPTYQEIVYPGLYSCHSERSEESRHEESRPFTDAQGDKEGSIDLVYKGVPGGMKYEFVVHPGANPDVIRLAYTGIEGLSIDDSGNLIIHTTLGDIKDEKPYTYQEIDGKKVEVECDFVILTLNEVKGKNLGVEKETLRYAQGDGYLAIPNPQSTNSLESSPPEADRWSIDTVNGIQKHQNLPSLDGRGKVENPPFFGRGEGENLQFVYGFELASYDPRYSLTIDPGLEYSTFLGGSDWDFGYGIALDPAGDAYVTGGTIASEEGFPTTAGAYDTELNGGDAFVARLDSTGSRLIYSTFLGGGGDDWGSGIALDTSGNAYVTGRTGSSNFPTTSGAFDTNFNREEDAFVCKLDSTGSVLKYSTFLGGSIEEYSNGIAVDALLNVYVVGWTNSSDFPTTTGAYDESYNGDWGDAFVAKLNPAGSDLIYSTYLGGSSSDYGNSIAVDGPGSAYVIGETNSSDFPATPGAFDTSWNGGWDAFVTKLNPTGSDLSYSTFLGGDDYDFGSGIALDASGNAYVTGDTWSNDFPTTPGAFDTSWNGRYDAFVTKLNPAGSDLSYSTFLGGSDWDLGYGIIVHAGSAYVTGWTGSSNFPTTSGAFDTSYNANRDAFVTRLDSKGSGLTYSTFLGGENGWDWGYGITLYASDNIYVTGGTSSDDFPFIPGAFGTELIGGWDAFVTRLFLELVEVCNNGIDDNGNGLVDCNDPDCQEDADGDGFIAAPCGDDCNDDNASVNPGVTEVCNDGFDNNCDGLVDCNDPDCAKPDLVSEPKGQFIIGPTSSKEGKVVKATLKVENQGCEPSGTFRVKTFLSNDANLDGGDILKKTSRVRGLEPGNTKSIKLTIKDKNSMVGKYLIASIDHDDAVVEFDENNNLAVELIP